jgi:hypothetical protein
MDYLVNGDVKLTQPKLLGALLEEHQKELELLSMRGILSPQRDQNTFLIESSAEFGRTEYLHLLGAIIYLTKSRPDIATAEVSITALHKLRQSV